MVQMDFKAHNEKVKEVWAAYSRGTPFKVPVTIDFAVRNWLLDPQLNQRKTTWQEYLLDKDVMLETQLLTQYWKRHNIISDQPMGIPEEGWSVFVDFQNLYEWAWLGAEIHYGGEPNTKQVLFDDNLNMLFDRGIPDTFDGIGKSALEYYEYFQEKARNYTFEGAPIGHVATNATLLQTDGPFTIACGLRGVSNFLIDIVEEPDYAKQLLSYVTEAILSRIKTARQYFGIPEKTNGWGFADDAISMLSLDTYREFVLPCHKRLVEELMVPGSAHSAHLCGNAQRFFPVMEKELNTKTFDTGFPVDFGKLYDDLSPDVCVYGGPHIALLKEGTPQEIETEVKRILGSGVMEKSKRFVLRDGNEVAPLTPLENINAVYAACEKYGYYNN